MRVIINAFDLDKLLSEFKATRVNQMDWDKIGLKYEDFSSINLNFSFKILDSNKFLFYYIKYNFKNEFSN